MERYHEKVYQNQRFHRMGNSWSCKWTLISTWHWMQPFKWYIFISIIRKGFIVSRKGRKIISSEGLVSLHHPSLINLFLSFSSFISSFKKWMWDFDLGCWILDFLYWINDDSCSYVVFFFSLLCLAFSFDQLDMLMICASLNSNVDSKVILFLMMCA